jgi:hypothetical protein
VILRARAGTTSLEDKSRFENQPPCALCKHEHQGVLPHYLLDCKWGPFLRLRSLNSKLLAALLPKELLVTLMHPSKSIGQRLSAIIGSDYNWESDELRQSVLQITAMQLIELNKYRPR